MTRPLFASALLASVTLLACTRPDPPKDAQATDTGGASAETGDTAYVPVETSGEVLSLLVEPSDIVVDPGATWRLRAVGGLENGSFRDVQPTFLSSDESVLTVDALGQVVALTEGSAEIEASYDGLSATAQVQVRVDGLITVTVVDASSGAIVPDAKVRIGAIALAVDSVTGAAELVVEPGVPTWVMAYGAAGSSYIPATVMDVVARDIQIPLRTSDRTDRGDAWLGGDVDFSRLIGDAGDPDKGDGLIQVGLAVPSMQDGPLFFDTRLLMAPDRTVEVMGLDMILPGNVFVREYIETWEVAARDGPVGVWAVGGPIPIDDALQLGSDISGIVDFVIPNLDAFSYTWHGDLMADAGVPLELDVAPDTSMGETVTVELPSFPDGFYGTEQPLVFALRDPGEGGAAVAGMARAGPGTMTLPRVPTGNFQWTGEGTVLAYAEAGGLGAGGARSLGLAFVNGGVAELPAWQEPPALESFHASTHEFVLHTDASAGVVRLNLEDRFGNQRDIYVPGGSRTDTLPTEGPEIGYGLTEWAIAAVGVSTGTYESLVASGGISQERLNQVAVTSGLLNLQVVGE